MAAFLVFFVVLCIDGAAYDRWRYAHHLRIIYETWQADGAPDPQNWPRYELYSKKAFIYTQTHVVAGQTQQCLFATTVGGGQFTITRDGSVLVVDRTGEARLLRIHKTKAAAW